MASEQKKTRKPNFSDDEVRCLLESIGQEKEPIQCKLQGAMTARLKKEAWSRVVLKVNAHSRGIVRSHDEIKKKWKDVKSAVMKEQASQRQTGGGGPMKETPFKELILFILGDRSDTVSGIEVMGTDSFLASEMEQTTSVNIDRGSSCSKWHQLTASTSNEDDKLSPTDNLSVADNVTKPTKRCLNMSSASALMVSDSNDANLRDANMTTIHANHVTPASWMSSTSTWKKVQITKQKQAKSKSPKDSPLFNSWLESEIEKNNAKKELIELLKRKTFLEIQNMEANSRNSTEE